MTIAEIIAAIKDQVMDDSISDDSVFAWIQEADNAIQTWRPKEISFDYWDYLLRQKNYSSIESKLKLPCDFRAFTEFLVGNDTTPYILKNFRNRNMFNNHVAWIIGGFLNFKAAPSAITSSILTYVHISDTFVSTVDEPELELVYHDAYIHYGKAKYYNKYQQTDLETSNMNEFEKVMYRKLADQEISRMQTNEDKYYVTKSAVV